MYFIINQANSNNQRNHFNLSTTYLNHSSAEQKWQLTKRHSLNTSSNKCSPSIKVSFLIAYSFGELTSTKYEIKYTM